MKERLPVNGNGMHATIGVHDPGFGFTGHSALKEKSRSFHLRQK